MLPLAFEEQNKCKDKHYPNVCLIIEQAAETISNMQPLVKKCQLPPPPSNSVFGNVDFVLFIFFHSHATDQDKAQMSQDSG